MFRTISLAAVIVLPLVAPAAPVEITVRDKTTGKPVPCRIHLKGPDGKPVQADKLPFWRDHFVCPGTVQLDLPAAKYTYEVERGPEHSRRAGSFMVGADGVKVDVELERVADLPKEGWWPGELHVHRPVEDVELLMRAEDLHVAPVITWWNNRNQWTATKRLPEEPLVRFDGNRFYHLMAGEDEREGGALLFFHLRQPLEIAKASREYPSPMKFLAEARQKKAWVDIEKPFWWDVPVWLASGQVDSIGLANNHMCRSQMLENEAWGRPRDVRRLPPPRGNGLWTQEIYYHILDCGLRLPPSAGSASGVLPNPVAYNRVYVQAGPELTYDGWWDGLRAGRCFVTNGPLLRALADGKSPGHVFTASEGKTVQVELKAKLTTQDPVAFLEIVQNGKVERKVPFAEFARTGSLGNLTFQTSGWFLVRAIADNEKTFRFASTGPFYVEVGATKRRISKSSAQFFLDWVKERAERVKLDDPAQRREVLEHHRAAEKFWQELLAKANAE